MYCRQCEYPLWNLRARACPECSTPFAPSTYEFVPSSVRFCCPHCDQSYYGQDDRGLIEPHRFTCAGCGREIDLDEMILRPAEGVSERQTSRGITPWLERRRRGRVKALFATAGYALARPVRLARGVPSESSSGEALAFMVGVHGLVVLGWLVPAMLMTIGWQSLTFGPSFGWWEIFWALYVLIPLGLSSLGMILLWPLVTHLVLRMTGPTDRGIDGTLQMMGYAGGAHLISAVPLIGYVIGPIWWLVSSAVMVRTGQRVHGGRAALAVVALPLLILLGTGGMIGSAMVGSSQTFGGGFAGPNVDLSTYQIVDTVQSSAWQGDGSGPSHIIELLVTNSATSWPGTSLVCHSSTQTTDDDVLVGDVTYTVFQQLDTVGRLKAAAKQLEKMPDGIIAYRFGDFVYTHLGADLTQQDPTLWYVVMLPDPDANPGLKPSDSIYIGTGDYQVRRITLSALPGELKDQNDYRAMLNLPPLPDLATITQAQPAIDRKARKSGG